MLIFELKDDSGLTVKEFVLIEEIDSLKVDELENVLGSVDKVFEEAEEAIQLDAVDTELVKEGFKVDEVTVMFDEYDVVPSLRELELGIEQLVDPEFEVENLKVGLAIVLLNTSDAPLSELEAKAKELENPAFVPL